MFLTIVAKPRHGEGGNVIFHGKICTWDFVKETSTLLKSKNGDRVTIKMISLKVT
jgi:hypothetical protein